MECFKCGADSDSEEILQAISNQEIVHVCKKCAEDEDIPIIKKPISKEEEKKSLLAPIIKKGLVVPRGEFGMRDLVDRNYLDRSERKTLASDLIDNFHWAIMVARRKKKISVKEVAERIQEPESVLLGMEKGVLPLDYQKIIEKLENALNVILFKDKQLALEAEKRKNDTRQQPARILEFKKESLDNLTIADLRELKKQKEAELEKNVETALAEEEGKKKKTAVGFFARLFGKEEEEKETEQDKEKGESKSL